MLRPRSGQTTVTVTNTATRCMISRQICTNNRNMTGTTRFHHIKNYRFSCRSNFATTAKAIDLSYQVFEPSTSESQASTPVGASNRAKPESRHPILFLHGLFGSKQNNRTISKVLARDLNRKIYALDLRNHGRSTHALEHNYTVMAEDIKHFIQQHQLRKAVLIGHSMGAKTAMVVALRSPDLVSALISVDNAPVSVPLRGDFENYVRAMVRIEMEGVTKQSEADRILQEYEESPPIRQFLLTNLVRAMSDGDQNNALRFRIPLAILSHSLDAMADFPFDYKDPNAAPRYKGPTLVVRGIRSHYVGEETLPAIRTFFPQSEVIDIEAGHWVISEKPEAFREAVIRFFQENYIQ